MIGLCYSDLVWKTFGFYWDDRYLCVDELRVFLSFGLYGFLVLSSWGDIWGKIWGLLLLDQPASVLKDCGAAFAPLTLSHNKFCEFIAPQRSVRRMERVKGIEPSRPAWKAGALPLSYTRII